MGTRVCHRRACASDRGPLGTGRPETAPAEAAAGAGEATGTGAESPDARRGGRSVCLGNERCLAETHEERGGDAQGRRGPGRAGAEPLPAGVDAPATAADFRRAEGPLRGHHSPLSRSRGLARTESHWDGTGRGPETRAPRRGPPCEPGCPGSGSALPEGAPAGSGASGGGTRVRRAGVPRSLSEEGWVAVKDTSPGGAAGEGMGSGVEGWAAGSRGKPWGRRMPGTEPRGPGPGAAAWG